MKTDLFTRQISIGTFWIRPERAGGVRLGLGRNRLRADPERSAGCAARGESRVE